MKNTKVISDPEFKEQFLEELNRDIGIVHRVCNSFYNTADSAREDLFQEIMYQLWKSYPRFNGDAKFSTWMYRVAFNTAITHSKKQDREPEKTEFQDNHYPESVTEKQDEQEKLRLLYSAIRTLKEIDRMIILLWLEATSYSEIAGITGLSTSNISVRLVRIKTLLKTKLENH
jgi:RNA polymerase sigma-70 factor, ECF subfamily